MVLQITGAKELFCLIDTINMYSGRTKSTLAPTSVPQILPVRFPAAKKCTWRLGTARYSPFGQARSPGGAMTERRWGLGLFVPREVAVRRSIFRYEALPQLMSELGHRAELLYLLVDEILA